MNRAAATFQRFSPRLVAIAIILALYGWVRLPALPIAERAQIASRFRFSHRTLPELPGPPPRVVRAVHPSLEGICSWISAVGAGVALNDLDGDGLSNDVIYVDTRTDAVIVAPVPGTPLRYSPFVLEPAPLSFDPTTMAPMGCLPGDFNEDGLLDLLVYYWGRTPIVFLRKPADSASNPTAAGFSRNELVAERGRWFTNAATSADLDGDGHVDLIIGNYFPDDARILDAEAGGTESMQHSMSRSFNGGQKHIFLWNKGTSSHGPALNFREAEGVLGDEVSHSWTLAIGANDLDGDLLPEIYLANDFGPDRLLHNRSRPGSLAFQPLEGRKMLTTPSSKVLGRDSFKGMGVDFGDLNGDGLTDIFVSNIAAEYSLLESHFAFLNTGEARRMRQGVAPFVDHSEALGLSRSSWAWEARLGDFDNDGVVEALQAAGFAKGTVDRWPELQELAMGNDAFLRDPKSWPRFQPGDDLSGTLRNPFFVRANDGRFRDISADLGLDEPGVSRGIATADVDGDGRLDFAVANQWASSTFHHNENTNTGSFVGLHLLLPLQPSGTAAVRSYPGHMRTSTPGRPATGAQARVLLPDGRQLVGQVDGGNGHSGKCSPDLHFGLGNGSSATSIRVELRWRDPDGAIHEDTVAVAPGWHTVSLGWTSTMGMTAEAMR